MGQSAPGRNLDALSAATPPGAPPAEPIPPALLASPDYEVIREINRGGMGVVYLARNRRMDRLEGLKVVSESLLKDAGAVERFEREMRSAARLNHQNIVTAYSAPPMDGLLAFAMEYVDGTDLHKLVQTRGPLPVSNACYYVNQAAKGLQHAHERQMVHRDIKPNNLMLTRDGKRQVIKILDFGLAKATSEQQMEGGLTRTGQMLGTPYYVAPEQIDNASKADIRADIYSLGCTLYYLLTGDSPFKNKASLFELLLAHHVDNPRALDEVRSDVPPELAAIVAKMMAKDPAQRFQQPAEIAEGLAPYFKQGITRMLAGTPANSTANTQPAATVSEAVTSSETRAVKPYQAQPAGPPAQMQSPLETLLEFVADQPAPVTAARLDRRSNRAAPTNPKLAKLWLGAAVGILLVGMIGLWATGVFTKVKTKDGILVIEVNEPDAEVFVDGDKADVTWAEGKQKATVQVKAGERQVEVKKDGFSVAGTTITLNEGDRQVFIAKLESIGPEAQEQPPRGKQRASATWSEPPAGDRTAFDFKTNPTNFTLRGHSAKVRFLSFSPDGSRLVSASNGIHDLAPGNDNTLRIWKLDPPQQIRQFTVNDGWFGPQGIAVSPDSGFVAVSAGWDWGANTTGPALEIFDIGTGVRKQKFKLSGRWAMRAVAFSKDGAAVYAARGGRKLHEWSLQSGRETAVVERIPANDGEMPFANVFMPDGDRVVSGIWNGLIRMWDRKTGEQIREYRGHEKNLTAVAVSADGTRLVSAAEDYSVRLWDADSGKELLTLTGLDVLVKSVAICPNKNWFATGENDGAVRIRDAATGKVLMVLPDGSGPMISLAISPSGQMIAAGGEDGSIQLWKSK